MPSNSVVVNDAIQTDMSVADSRWRPNWVVVTQGGSEVGIVIDDHCFVVLSSDNMGQWRPIKHIPSVVAREIG